MPQRSRSEVPAGYEFSDDAIQPITVVEACSVEAGREKTSHQVQLLYYAGQVTKGELLRLYADE